MASVAMLAGDLLDAERAFARVLPEIEALRSEELAAMNVDLVSATSIVLGVADRILTFRERMARLPEFELRHVDRLVDYALAAWYAHVTNLPAADPRDATQLLAEVGTLRSKLLSWAAPLVGNGNFDEAAIDRIREGSGYKDATSDLIALMGLYRSKWDEVKAICGVTEADLARAAEIGPRTFALVSQRENRITGTTPDGSLRVRGAWTLVDRAYGQCRRAVAYLRFDEGDADSIAPSLRRNVGRTPSAQPAAAANGASAAPPTAAAPPAGALIGGSQAPFSAAT